MYFKVKLARSVIGLPQATRDAARALRLTKTHKTVYVPINAINLGNILKIRYLINLDKVDHIPPKSPRTPSGYTIIGSAFPWHLPLNTAKDSHA